MRRPAALLSLFTLANCSGCAALGIVEPTVATNECFAYCLDVPIEGQTVSWCYGSKAEQLADLTKLNLAGVKATVKK